MSEKIIAGGVAVVDLVWLLDSACDDGWAVPAVSVGIILSGDSSVVCLVELLMGEDWQVEVEVVAETGCEKTGATRSGGCAVLKGAMLGIALD